MVYIKDFDDQHLGGIDLRRVIFARYSMARGLVDSYRLNNDLVQKHEHAFWRFKEFGNRFHEPPKASAYYHALVEYSQALKKGHSEVKKQVAELLTSLRKHL